MSVATGPKISSWLVRHSGPRPSTSVGSTNHPSSQRPSSRALPPPVRMRPPSSRASVEVAQHLVQVLLGETSAPCSVLGVERVAELQRARALHQRISQRS